MGDKVYLKTIRQEHPDKPDECHRCQLFLGCESYKIPWRVLHRNFKSKKKILLVCQNPGKEEDVENKILVGKSGQLLMKYVNQYFSKYNVYATNAVKCYSEEVKIHHVRQCKDYLLADVIATQPDVIIAMGTKAREAMAEAKIDRKEWETCVHPSFVLRGNDDISIHGCFSRVVARLEGTLDKAPMPMWALRNIQVILNNLYESKEEITIGFDTEWNTQTNTLHTVGLYGEGTECVTGAYEFDDIEAQIQNLLRSPQVTLVGHNLTSDMEYFLKLGWEIKCKLIDTLILHRELIGAETAEDIGLRKAGLKVFARDYLMMDDYWSDITEEDFLEYSEKLAVYCYNDAYTALKLYQKFLADFPEEYRKMEYPRSLDMRMIIPITEAQMDGIRIDTKKLANHRTRILKEVVANKIWFEEQYNINPSSPAQVLQTFRNLGVKIDSTKEEVLQEVDHELSKRMLDFRHLNILKTQFIDSLYETIGDDNIFHHKVNICGTNTGRLSSSIHRIPDLLRDMFCSVYGEAGQLLTIDASQSEYRCLAYLSGYQPLIDKYRAGIDMHQWCADICGISRRDAKTVNFGALYLASREKLITVLIDAGLTRSDAESKIDKYLEAIDGIQEYQRGLIAKADRLGYVESVFGRRGYRLRPHQIVNYPIQSLSADLNKVRFLWLYDKIKEQRIVARLWLEFHDGIEVDCIKTEIPKIQELVIQMPNTIPDILDRGYEFPLPVELKINTDGWRYTE